MKTFALRLKGHWIAAVALILLSGCDGRHERVVPPTPPPSPQVSPEPAPQPQVASNGIGDFVATLDKDPTVAEARRRNQAFEKEIGALAEQQFTNMFAPYGESWFGKYVEQVAEYGNPSKKWPQDRYIELRVVTRNYHVGGLLNVDDRSMADKLNGIEATGTVEYKARATREYKGGWEQWKDTPDQSFLYFQFGKMTNSPWQFKTDGENSIRTRQVMHPAFMFVEGLATVSGPHHVYSRPTEDEIKSILMIRSPK